MELCLEFFKPLAGIAAFFLECLQGGGEFVLLLLLV